MAKQNYELLENVYTLPGVGIVKESDLTLYMEKGDVITKDESGDRYENINGINIPDDCNVKEIEGDIFE